MKGDHLVGKYYVLFDQEYKKEIEQLVQQGKDPEAAKKEASLLREAQEMLRAWEQGDPGVYQLWETMNKWVTDGFDVTYKNLGVDFDHVDYESETYKLGKEEVLKGLKSEVFYQEENNSVWADLTEDGLDKKLLLRADGTSVYMTQDIGTAIMRQKRYGFDDMVYVVGNEQDYHFQVLALVLQKLGYSWAKSIFHLSYGMVELPFGKMKSREGTVVDADDLMDEMIGTAREMAAELGKLDDFTDKEKEDIYRMIGLGALKYFILKVDPRKNMVFNPEESIDFNGNTGPFVQYTYARIQSVFRKANEQGIVAPVGVDTGIALSAKEKELLKWIYLYPETVKEAGKNMSPADVAGYVFELAKMFNQFYHDHPILKEPDEKKRDFRLHVSGATREIIAGAMGLLGIEVPPRM
jgi:arginyl-tRNA synthetase